MRRSLPDIKNVEVPITFQPDFDVESKNDDTISWREQEEEEV
jgi:hypothetical protein